MPLHTMLIDEITQNSEKLDSLFHVNFMKNWQREIKAAKQYEIIKTEEK